MQNCTKYIIRIPTSDLSVTQAHLSQSGFECIHHEKEFLQAWFQIENQLVAVKQCEDQHPSLVKYSDQSQDEINRLDELGIICHFEADEFGNHFESSFFDPGGTKIIIADFEDLPKSISHFTEKCSFEVSLPSGSDFKDSINFWSLFGFKIFNTKAKPHAWSSFIDQNFRLAIHQHYEWTKPGICFPANTNIKKSQFAEAKLRSKLYFSDFF